VDTLNRMMSKATDSVISGMIDSQIAGSKDTPVQTVLLKKLGAGSEAQAETHSQEAEVMRKDADAAEQEAGQVGQAIDGENIAGDKAEATDETAAVEPTKEATASLTDRKVAFIYHSHSRESWLPELAGTKKNKPSEAFDESINITKLGERLQRQLEANGVGAIHSDTDYNTAVPSFNYNYSYSYSSKTVREAIAVYPELTYLFDLHRDASPRKNTTIRINGKDYAKVYFIIGKANPHWKENEAFAGKIHEALNKALPGISKGILNKSKSHGHGEYNQTLSDSSVLIEVGGYGNSLEESNRTIDALAKVIAGIVRNAEKADATPARQVANAANPS
jgi:stage II sporulation protein P